MSASAYIDPVIDPLGPLMAGDIEPVFRTPAGRSARDCVHKRLYAKGLPHPFEHGLRSAKAVADWPAGAGRAERMSRTSQRVRPTPPVRSLGGSQKCGPKTLASLK